MIVYEKPLCVHILHKSSLEYCCNVDPEEFGEVVIFDCAAQSKQL